MVAKELNHHQAQWSFIWLDLTSYFITGLEGLWKSQIYFLDN